ncbi:MAG: hypothetical protein NT062_31535 [Proteobacteria bacterium]|nr:hypothetical protein [Pseudomonadota bacterium]
MSTPQTPELTPAQIEQFRTVGLRLDRAGRLWHDGAEVTHARLRQALLRWLDVRDDGRDIIRLDATRYAYVDVEDAHLRARAARWDDDRCTILWDDERELELPYATLSQAADHALYVRVGKLRGRIAGPAYHAVAERIMEDGEDGEGFVLEAVGRRWPITRAPDRSQTETSTST